MTGLTAYSTVVLPPPGREDALAVITLFAKFIIHPKVARKSCDNMKQAICVKDGTANLLPVSSESLWIRMLTCAD